MLKLLPNRLYYTTNITTTRTLLFNMQKKQITLNRFFTSIKPNTDKDKKDNTTSTTTNTPSYNTPKRSPSISDNDTSSSPKKQKISIDNTITTDTNFISDIPYSDVCNLFQEIESISSRLSIIKLCSDFFTDIVINKNPKNLIPITYLFINKLGPDYEHNLELGLGETLLMKTISESCGNKLSQIKIKFRETGDLGQIALDARNVQPTMFKPKPLTVGFVFNNLKTIAGLQGKDSQNRKIKIIKNLLTSCKGVEAKFLIRSLESKLRIGLAEKTVLISLSKALLIYESKFLKLINENDIDNTLIDKAEDNIKSAFCQIPNYEIIINKSLTYGITNLLDHCYITPGIPLKPMLAKPTKSISEVLDSFQGKEFTSEYKYDGERAQVHLFKDENNLLQSRIYSRNGEDMTQRYPEINMSDYLINPNDVNSIILDCEAVAWDRSQNKILPFQVLTTRKRKDVNLNEIKVRVCLFAFDILHFNGNSLIDKSLRERREILKNVTKPTDGEFQFAIEMTTSNLDELQIFLDKSVKDACEGLMVKSLDGESSHYEPSKRSRNWLKLKKDYLDGIGDSLDLCVLGAYYGKGKRTGTYGGFLLGCFNQDTDEYETCCKIGTGFSDEMLQTLYEKLSKTTTDGPLATYVFDSSAEPDVWFEPTLLFEVLTADLSLSPTYKAGSSNYEKGISLRFPRFIRLRDDKSPHEATSSEQIIELYEDQSHFQN